MSVALIYSFLFNPTLARVTLQDEKTAVVNKEFDDDLIKGYGS